MRKKTKKSYQGSTRSRDFPVLADQTRIPNAAICGSLVDT